MVSLQAHKMTQACPKPSPSFIQSLPIMLVRISKFQWSLKPCEFLTNVGSVVTISHSSSTESWDLAANNAPHGMFTMKLKEETRKKKAFRLSSVWWGRMNLHCNARGLTVAYNDTLWDSELKVRSYSPHELWIVFMQQDQSQHKI